MGWIQRHAWPLRFQMVLGGVTWRIPCPGAGWKGEALPEEADVVRRRRVLAAARGGATHAPWSRGLAVKVQMARGRVNSLFKNLQASLNNHVSIKDG
jgi:hypothetical protein